MHALIEIQLTWAELHRWNAGKSLQQKSLPAYAVWLGVEGEVEAHHASRSWRVGPGEALIYPAHAAREITVRRDALWYSMGLLASSPGCSALLSVPDAPLCWRPRHQSLFPAIAAALLQANVNLHEQASSENVLMRDGLLHAFFGVLWSECGTQTLDAAAGANWPSWLAVAVQVLRDRPQTSMAALADEVGISPAQLRRGFNEYLGTSPQNYVRVKRLNAARLMIEATDLPIHRIAKTHGFSSAALFTRTIKQAFGLAPLELRRAVQQPPV
jgi:AraC-like DNA-binding protein